MCFVWLHRVSRKTPIFNGEFFDRCRPMSWRIYNDCKKKKKSRLQNPIASHKNYTTIFRRNPGVFILKHKTDLHTFGKPTIIDINFNFKQTRFIVPLIFCTLGLLSHGHRVLLGFAEIRTGKITYHMLNWRFRRYSTEQIYR